MQMRPAIQIKSALKALTDVVLPAVDPQNKPAQEQARLVIGLLHLLAQQLPTQFRFDCDELARLVEFSNELRTLARGGTRTSEAVANLGNMVDSAFAALEGARTAPDQVEHWVRSLRSASGALVTQVYCDGDPACRQAVRDAVLAMSAEQLLRDRSLLLMQGWEPDPDAIPPLSALLDGAQP